MTISPKTAADAPVITLENVNKWYGDFHVLRDVSMQVAQGAKIVICGPSGSGKSTAIRCINGLEEHQEGRISVDGIELTDDLRSVNAIRRRVGMVFHAWSDACAGRAQG
jgi:general L-amino acid transport system ATP-binding protein